MNDNVLYFWNNNEYAEVARKVKSTRLETEPYNDHWYYQDRINNNEGYFWYTDNLISVPNDYDYDC